MLFLALLGISLVTYALFGRDRKAFSRQSKLLRQKLQETAAPLLEQLLARQAEEIGRLETQSPVRHRLISASSAKLVCDGRPCLPSIGCTRSCTATTARLPSLMGRSVIRAV